MDNNQDLANCTKRCRIVAALTGAVAAVLLVLLAGFGVLPALIVGILIAVVVAWLFYNKVCQDLPAQDVAPVAQSNTAPTPVAEQPAVAANPPAPAAAAAAPALKVNPSTSLPGQADLAARKGEWKYEGEGAAKPAAKAKPAKKAAAKKADTAPVASPEGPGTKPATLSVARDSRPDDLKQIKGVGPKLEALLHTMGFYHFDQIAAWGGQEVAWVDQNLQGFKGRVSRDDWVVQAKILAEGGTTEFSSKVKKGDVY